MECSVNGVPMFDGQSGLKHEYWSSRMKTFLKEKGYDIWKSVVTGYNGTKKLKTIAKKELKKNQKIAMDFILDGLYDLVKDKVGKCSSIKEIWDKLHNIYSSPITDLDNAQEDTCTVQEEISSSCETNIEEEECKEAEVDYREEMMCFI
jgi:hypothetical protein